MTHADFKMGMEFRSGAGSWRVTDIGTRTVVAIRLDTVMVALNENGVTTRTTLNRAGAEREGWFNGPPYAVNEKVFDEQDMKGCRLEGRNRGNDQQAGAGAERDL